MSSKYPVTLIPATAASTKTREFTVRIAKDAGTYVGTCDRLPGWTAVADSVEELKTLAFDGVRFCIDDPSMTILVNWEVSA